MGVRARVASFFNRLTRANDPWRQQLLAPLALVPQSLHLSDDERLSASAVWACVRAIVDPIASSEVKVFTREASGSRKHLPDDPIGYYLNVRSDPDFTAQALKEIVLTDAVVDGNGYAEIIRDGAGRVSGIAPLFASQMQPIRDRDTGVLWYRYTQNGEEAVYLPAYDVLHVRGPSIGGLLGDGTAARAVKAIALHVAQEKYATHYFANGTFLGAIVKMPASLSEASRTRLEKDLQKNFGANGARRRGIAFFEQGMEYEAIGADANESQIVPSRAFSIEEIARYFGVPLVRLGVQAAAQGYGTNVQQLNLQFVRDTLAPWCNRFTEEAAYKLFPQKAPWRQVEIDTAWLTQGDDEQRARTHKALIECGVESVNDALEAEGRNGIGAAGDLRLVSSSLVVLDEKNLQKPEPAPAPKPQPQDVGEPGEGEDDEMEEGMRRGASALLDAMERYGRRVRARSADLARAGKSPEEIAANIASTLRPQAVAAITAALDGVASCATSETKYAGPVATTSTPAPVTE